MTIPAAFREVEWYGRGPGENYPDSCLAGRIDVFESSVDALYTPYVRPQEYGNRMDVRWLTLANASGFGIRAEGNPAFNFSAHRYALQDLTRATHTCDLVRSDFITLNLDYRQRGLGSASCGPDVLPQYELVPHEFRFRVLLRSCVKRGRSA